MIQAYVNEANQQTSRSVIRKEVQNYCLGKTFIFVDRLKFWKFVAVLCVYEHIVNIMNF